MSKIEFKIIPPYRAAEARSLDTATTLGIEKFSLQLVLWTAERHQIQAKGRSPEQARRNLRIIEMRTGSWTV